MILHADESLDRAQAAFAARDWQRARSLLEPLANADGQPSAKALQLLSICHFKLGAITNACKTMEQAFASLVKQGENRAAAMVAAYLVALYEIEGADAACRGWEQRGLRLVANLGPCIERGYLALCRTGCDIHDPLELEERADLALELAAQFGDKDLELRARAEKGLAQVSRGFVNAGFALLDEVMVAIAAGEMQDEDMRGRSICSMLSACERTGDIARAEYWCKRIEQEPYLQHVVLGTHCRVTYGVVDALTGEWQRAEERLTEVLRSGGFSIPYHRAVSAGRLAEILLQQGRYDAAAEALKGYEDRFEAIPALARLRIAQRQYEQAAALLRSIVRGLGEDRIRLAPVLALLVEVELLRDDRPAAERAFEQLRSLEERCESNEIRAYTRLAAGALDRHAGDFDGAVEELETALMLLIHYDRPLLRAQIRLELARALKAKGSTGLAVVEAEGALTTFRRLGVTADAAVAEQLLGTLPPATAGPLTAGTATPEPGARESTTALSPRETEVAELVAEGMTNREIVERLVLSTRTVEGHIERILGKLNFHTRTQVAMWVRPALSK
jgi:DNA-binding CsgD family transcriptional regulator/tetratricopeptide (TPR) repeat protein